MRRIYGFILLSGVVVFALAPLATAGITGSAHDFGQFGWAKNQICLPCHTPHNSIVRDANGNIVNAPLWNHTLSTAVYTLYLDPTTGQGVTGQVDTNSRVCLSCHDGTVAVDAFGGGAGTQQLTGGLLGTDLSNDHPIGEAAVWPNPVPADFVDQSLRDAAGIMPLRQLADARLVVGCTSCHEPHNRKNVAGLLWVSNSGPGTTVNGKSVSGSVLCLNCHNLASTGQLPLSRRSGLASPAAGGGVR